MLSVLAASEFYPRLHPLVLHVPLGMLAAVCLAELLTLGDSSKQDKKLLSLRRSLYVVAAIAAGVTASTGWELWEGGEFEGALVDGHRRIGVAFAVTLILAAALDLFGRRVATVVGRRLLLVVALGFATLTGHLGGGITHGVNYLHRDAPPMAVEALDMMDQTADTLAGLLGNEPINLPGNRGAGGGGGADDPGAETGAEPDAGDGSAGGSTLSDKLDLIDSAGAPSVESAALAVLDTHCLECHGPNKQKGKLRLDTVEGIRKVAPEGDPENSELLYRVQLPADDLDVMPPEDALPPEALEAIEAWIRAGAPVTAAAEQQDRRQQDQEAWDKRLSEVRVATRALVLPTSQGSTSEVRVDFSRSPYTYDADTLAGLVPVAEAVVELSLAGCDVDAAMLSSLPELPKLERLHLERSGADDEAVRTILARAPRVAYLNLHGTDVSAAVLESASDLDQLRRLVLFDTAVDAEDIDVFAAAHPQVKVTGDLGLQDLPVGGALEASDEVLDG